MRLGHHRLRSSTLAHNEVHEGSKLAWNAVETALDPVNGVRRTGVIKARSSAALRLANPIDKTSFGLAVASAAQRADSFPWTCSLVELLSSCPTAW